MRLQEFPLVQIDLELNYELCYFTREFYLVVERGEMK